MDAQQFFEELLGAGPFRWDWWTAVTYDEGYQWDKYPTDWGLPFLTVSILDPDDEDEEKEITKKLSLNDLVRAYNNSGQTQWDNHDTNSSDNVLQLAVFGEIIYG